MIRKFRPLIIVIFFSLLLAPFQKASAQGDLMIMPKRVVFDGTQRSQEINLANTGKDTAIYAISFINYKMTESGSFEQIENPQEGQRFATEFLRYFPRRVTLAPNEAQTIRVQLTRTGNLEEGEYRSHMYFRAIENQTALGEEDINSSEGIAIQIKTVFGISIPVIIRNGESTAKIHFSDVKIKLNGDNPQISMVINRNGNMSVYGDLELEYISSQGEVSSIGIVKGISVYTPNKKRFFKMDLKSVDGLDLTQGTLKINYISDTDQELASFKLTL